MNVCVKESEKREGKGTINGVRVRLERRSHKDDNGIFSAENSHEIQILLKIATPLSTCNI